MQKFEEALEGRALKKGLSKGSGKVYADPITLY